MSRNAGDVGRRLYHILVRASSMSSERSVATHEAWADVALRPRLDHTRRLARHPLRAGLPAVGTGYP